jgi:hypothetical protein
MRRFGDRRLLFVPNVDHSTQLCGIGTTCVQVRLNLYRNFNYIGGRIYILTGAPARADGRTRPGPGSAENRPVADKNRQRWLALWLAMA